MVSVPSTMMELGTRAPGFRLPDPDGRYHELADLADAPVLVVAFICNHCPYVQHIRTVLAEVTGRLIDRGVAVVGINSNDTTAYPDDAPPRMAEEAATFGYRFPYLVDADQSVARAYRAACTPDFFVFDAGRALVYRGQFDASRPRNDTPVTGADLTSAVDAALAGRPPLPDQWPSLGCNIKWQPGTEPDYAP
ncbi:MAG: thioredoxin family protein [Actinobacteria bacterium]|nr:thioredoxin family protein [Actinomycetota bacterium]